MAGAGGRGSSEEAVFVGFMNKWPYQLLSFQKRFFAVLLIIGYQIITFPWSAAV